jgi:hypothetical protein
MFFWKKKKVLSLKGTWHVCDHDFECQMVDEKGDYAEFQCKKCKVFATTEFRGQMVILVNPEDNHPFVLPPWGIGKRNAKGIVYNKNNHD